MLNSQEGNPISGFAPGIVTDIEDPKGLGRVKCELPGLLDETPYWIMPMNWPGGGRGDGQGSQYRPPPVGSQVAVIFEFGQWREADSHAMYLTGYYGQTAEGGQAGPEIISDAADIEEARGYTVLWEGEKLRAYVIEHGVDNRLVLEAKETGSKVEINATTGEGDKSETINIEARTQLTLYSRGTIDIQGDAGCQIQGRLVNDITTRGI